VIVVRILDEGQYELASEARDELVARDTRLLSALEKDDRAAYETELSGLLAFVRSGGTEVALDVIKPSEFVLPNAELSMPGVRALLADHPA
jgi:hypothetical protein